MILSLRCGNKFNNTETDSGTTVNLKGERVSN